jgi:SAM-dependent methyltransferase
MTIYNKTFYEVMQDDTYSSPEVVIPILINLIQPKSVVDVGCGIGMWLSTFNKYGVEDVLGLDGDYVDTKMLKIPATQFMTWDLQKPIQLEQQFDLVVSLEVAEHLPPQSAESFVNSLVQLGPLVLFSAAIPYQGGPGHVNEQWPEYWAALFKKKGYQAIDCLRYKFWNNPALKWYYAQNMVLYASSAYLEQHPTLKEMQSLMPEMPVALIHPNHYLSLMDPQTMSPLKLLRWGQNFICNLPVFIKGLISRKFLKRH